MAMSQFSFGKIHEYQLKGEKLPYLGGWDDNDQLTNDPDKILNTERGLPVGYWKGSALSMILDMLATLLSAGNSTARISNQQIETGVSQVFICIDPSKFGDSELQENLDAFLRNHTNSSELYDFLITQSFENLSKSRQRIEDYILSRSRFNIYKL